MLIVNREQLGISLKTANGDFYTGFIRYKNGNIYFCEKGLLLPANSIQSIRYIILGEIYESYSL